MANSSNAFSVTISAVDKASAQLDAVNKRIAAMNAPAERFNKSVARFGEGNSINKLSEGFLSLGNNALGAFRAVERMVSPMASITSAASIASIAEMERRWGAAGNTITKTAYALNTPVPKLSALEGAFQLAGSSAAAADKTMAGLNDTIHDAAFGRGDAAARLAAVGIQARDPITGKIIETRKALDQLSDWLQQHPDAHQQLRGLTSVGGDPDALAALKGGSQGLDEYVRKAVASGGTLSERMAENASRINQDFARLELNLKGIFNRIADDYSGLTDRVLSATSRWIEKNQELAKSITEVASGGAGAYAATETARRALKLLNQEKAANTLATVRAPVLLPLATRSDTASNEEADSALAAQRKGAEAYRQWQHDHPNLWARYMPTWLGGDPGAGAPLSAPAPPDAPGVTLPGPATVATGERLRNLSHGAYGNLVARGESGAADYNAVNRGAMGNYETGMENLVNMTVEQVQAGQHEHRFGAAGRYQFISKTLDDAVQKLHLTGKEKFDSTLQDRLFEEYENQKHPEIGAYIRGGGSLHAALSGAAQEYASFPDPDTGRSHYAGVANNRASVSLDEATQALNQAREDYRNGKVTVEISLKGAPAGTTATASASGVAVAAPPRVETALPAVAG